ncbi:MAG: sigma-54 interaction domain-containing protein [Candidatus Zixiibacteriota bacterium]
MHLYKFSRKLDRFQQDLATFKSSYSRNIKVATQELTSLREVFDSLSGLEVNRGSRRKLKLLDSHLQKLEKELSAAESDLFESLSKLWRNYLRIKNRAEDLSKERRIYRTLYELLTVVYSERNIQILLDTVLESAVDIMSAECGCLEIYNQDSSLQFKLTKDSTGSEVELKNSNLKPAVTEAVLASGNPITIGGLLSESIPSGEEKTEEEEEQAEERSVSLLCVPLKTNDKILGTIYVHRDEENGDFAGADSELLSSLAEKVALAIENHLLFSELQEEQEKLIEDLRKKYEFEEILGASPQMAKVLSTVADIADTDSTVVIEGESGTGKELLARAIHFNSGRAKKPFIPINCAAIPETLLESELFGYEKGAFTGAVKKKLGKFQIANGGTIFLDEIGELSPVLQVKLLRFLSTQEFEPLGSTEILKSDVRIITATNRNLSEMIQTGEFREDLYYRVNVIKIELPPLRDRKGDLELLTEHFIEKFSKRYDRKLRGIDDNAMETLLRYNFPGNVRELENTIERAVVLTKATQIGYGDLPDYIKSHSNQGDGEVFPKTNRELMKTKRELYRKTIGELERRFLLSALEEAAGNISEAARRAQMQRKQFQRLMKRHNVATATPEENKEAEIPAKT